MADELHLTLNMAFTKAGITLSDAEDILVDVSGNDVIVNSQSVGTSNEAILVGDTAPGYVIIVNTDATNYVEIFGDNMNAQKISKLLPGEFCVLRLDGSTTIYARANTGACVCQVYAIDL